MKIFLDAILIILSAIIIVVVMLQPSKNDGANFISGGNQNYFAKNKIRTYEKTLARLTVVASTLFVVTIIGLSLINK